MLNLFRKQPKGNPTKTVIIKHGGKSESTNKTVSIPLGRSGKLTEVASTVCFLASDRAGYIHGTVVNVSGGKTRA